MRGNCRSVRPFFNPCGRFGRPCARFPVRAEDLALRAGQLPVRGAIFPSVRPLFDLCGTCPAARAWKTSAKELRGSCGVEEIRLKFRDFQFWERTRPACRFGRRARTFVPQIFFFVARQNLLNDVFGATPKTARRRRALPKPNKIARRILRWLACFCIKNTNQTSKTYEKIHLPRRQPARA